MKAKKPKKQKKATRSQKPTKSKKATTKARTPAKGPGRARARMEKYTQPGAPWWKAYLS